MGHGSCGSQVSWLVGQADHRSQNVTHCQPQQLACYCNKKCYIIVWSLFEVRIAADYDPQADESVAPLVHSEASEPDVVLIYRAYMAVKLTPLDCKSPSACLDRRHRIPFANPPHLYSNLFNVMIRKVNRSSLTIWTNQNSKKPELTIKTHRQQRKIWSAMKLTSMTMWTKKPS